MTAVADNLLRIRASLPEGVELVAVSKFHPAEALMQAYLAGQRIFGESRQQELLRKIPLLPADVRWHFIGHLQTNKVRSIVGRVALIESVDSERLLATIDSEARRAGVRQPVLVQLHVAQEETKTGFLPAEAVALFAAGARQRYPNVEFRGVMGMATNTDDAERVSADFSAIAAARQALLQADPELSDFNILSMGMSHDYQLAIAAGATMVRIGTSIFGERQY